MILQQLPPSALFSCLLANTEWYTAFFPPPKTCLPQTILLTIARQKLAKDGMVWKHRCATDFGVAERPDDVDKAWMTTYRELSLTPAWDPSCTDSSLELSNENRTILRVGVTVLFPKSIADRPVNMKRKHTIRMKLSHSKFLLGFLCAHSKMHLHDELNVQGTGQKVTDILTKRSGGGCVMYQVIGQTFQKKSGDNQRTTSTTVPSLSPEFCTIHIEPQHNQILWEVDGQQVWVSDIPSPEPVFLVYSNSHASAGIEILTTSSTSRS